LIIQLIHPQARNEFLSEHGDSFTLLRAYNQWIYTKTKTKESSKKWARRHGIEEQRLYEISKLRQQFKDLLADSQLLNEMEQNKTEDDWYQKLFGRVM
jgi:HrpA-like RNA helicase